MKRSYLLLVTLFLSCNLFSQTFWHQYTPTIYGYNASVLTPDGGLMIVTNFTDSSWMVPRLMSIDSIGGIVWSLQLDLFPDFNRGRFVDIVRTSDNNYVAVGQMLSGNTQQGLLMYKFDLNGSEIWTKLIYPVSCSASIYGGYESHCIVEAKDKGFAVSGSCGAAGGNGMFIFKTDSTGNPEWFKAYYDHKDLTFWFRNLCQDSDSGYIFFNQYNTLNQDALIIHTDKYGNTLMTATLDSLNTSYLNAVFNIDGNVYLCFENGFVRSNLDTIDFWLPTYSFPFGSSKFRSMEKCMNSDLILSMSYQGGTIAMLRTDTAGMPVWARADSPGGFANEFYERPDGRFIFLGTGIAVVAPLNVILFDSTANMDCFSGPVNVTRDSVLERLRYAPGFEASCGVAFYVPPMHWHDVGSMTDNCLGASVSSNEYQNIEVFPNPTTGKIQLNGLSAPYEIELVSLDGRRLVAMVTQEQSISLDLSGYPKGVYAIRLLKNETITILKVVLQ